MERRLHVWMDCSRRWKTPREQCDLHVTWSPHRIDDFSSYSCAGKSSLKDGRQFNSQDVLPKDGQGPLREGE